MDKEIKQAEDLTIKNLAKDILKVSCFVKKSEFFCIPKNPKGPAHNLTKFSFERKSFCLDWTFFRLGEYF